MRARIWIASLPFVFLVPQTATAQENAVLTTNGPFRIWAGTTDGALDVVSNWGDLPLEFSFAGSNENISINGFASAELDRHVLVFHVNAATSSNHATQLLVLLEGPLQMSNILRPRVPFRLTVVPSGVGEFTFSLKTDSATRGYTSSFLQVGVLQLEQFNLRAGLDDALPRTLLIPTFRDDTIRMDASQLMARFPMDWNSSDQFEATAWVSTKEPLLIPEPSRKALHATSLIGFALAARSMRRRRRT